MITIPSDEATVEDIPFPPDPPPVFGWRRDLPTVAEVRRFRWWWVRAHDRTESVVDLQIDTRHALPCIVVEGRFRLDLDDFGGDEAEWAIATPP